MSSIPTVSIVTPCYNGASYIKETLQSVLNQRALLSNRCNLEYIIYDGCSTDSTVEKIRSCNAHPQFESLQLITEPDQGMYDALAKGLQRCSGDIIAYINAGDYYHATAFDTVLDLFEAHPVNWITGYNTVYNEQSSVVSVELPYRYRSRFLACGFYGTKLPPLQQESTFWSSQLLKLIDYDFLATLKYAGDYYLWRQFSREYPLNIVESYLGGFRVHKGQLSGDKGAYLEEMMSIADRPSLIDHLQASWDQALWYMPGRIKKLFNPNHLFRFDHEQQEWR
jgi:glycosyltransferase involved in cell wall biosynthesis